MFNKYNIMIYQLNYPLFTYVTLYSFGFWNKRVRLC